MNQKNRKIEFGDFQTPDSLALEVCSLLKKNKFKPTSFIEPTCGAGSFVSAAIASFPSIKKGLAVDIDSNYVKIAASAISDKSGAKVDFGTSDFFDFDWEKAIQKLPDPILVIGNPPWVTNSRIGSLKGSNLPPKANFQKLKGLDALTGKSNFDISEWMLIRLFRLFSGRTATIAMLCKLSVARKVLADAWANNLQLSSSSVYEIDTLKNFDASVEACLLVSEFAPGRDNKECEWYESLNEKKSKRTMGWVDGRIVADADSYRKWQPALGLNSPDYTWRTGVKHDCSKVMELWRLGKNIYQNGLGETVALEEKHLYPLLKSSEVFSARAPTRWVIITQKKVGDDTGSIAETAPLTWAYLQAHKSLLEKRGSSIYKNRPPFSIFGIGDYSFSPWKIAVSGLYKEPKFRLIGKHSGKPVIPDDTVNFIPVTDESEGSKILSKLNSGPTQNFLNAIIFWDAKRPLTVEKLKQLQF